jgi:hypothetical protein
MSDECNDGACDLRAGGCVKRPARQDAVCGRGNVCGGFDACGGFSGSCGSTGTQSRSCTQDTCQTGACTSTDYTDTQSCSRDTSGTVCGSTVVSDCSACAGSSASGCALDGQQTCTCTDLVCMNDICQAVASSCVLTGCAEHMVGAPCGVTRCGVNPPRFSGLCCNRDHLCSDDCPPCS